MTQAHAPILSSWVRIKTGHDSILKDVPELKFQLEGLNIPVQFSKPWRPACSTGLEFVLDYFANLSYQDVIIQGLIFDAFKSTVHQVWSFLKSFAGKNEHPDFDPIIKIKFDDFTLIFYGLEYHSIENQTVILEALPKHLAHLESMGITGITVLEIPCLPSYLPDNASDSEEIWKITFGTCETAFYLPYSQSLL